MATELARLRPDWPALPDDLERAWTWMEEQGYGRDAPAGYVLAPCADSASPAFVAGLTLDGYFEPGTPGFARLLPIAKAAGDGSQVLLWRDPADDQRVVVLDSEGSGYLLAEDARDLLVLLGVGYDELTEFSLGEPPEDPVPDADLAPYRAWLAAELGAKVPAEWPAVGDDAFTAWLDAELGNAPEAAPELPASQTTMPGDVNELLALLGTPDGADAAARVAALTGAAMKAKLSSSGAPLRKVGIEAESDRHGISTFWIRMTDRPIGTIVRTAGPAYPRPGALIQGLDATSTPADAVALFGEPAAQGALFASYIVGGRHVNLGFENGVLTRVTLMTKLP